MIATLHELTEDALIDILTKPKKQPGQAVSEMFEMDGVKLKFTKGALQAIARKALVRESGARGLRAILEEAMLDIMYEVPRSKASKKWSSMRTRSPTATPRSSFITRKPASAEPLHIGERSLYRRAARRFGCAAGGPRKNSCFFKNDPNES